MQRKGKVKMFNQLKGYGLITLEDGKEVFFHISELRMEGYKTIDSGTEVEFELIEANRGLLAHNIVKIENDETV